MSGKKVKECRRWPRLSLAIPVFVRGLDQERREFLEFGSILNVSAGGVLLAIRKRLWRNSRIWLEMPVGIGVEVREHIQRRLRARVLRISLTEGGYLYAAQFYSPLK